MEVPVSRELLRTGVGQVECQKKKIQNLHKIIILSIAYHTHSRLAITARCFTPAAAGLWIFPWRISSSLSLLLTATTHCQDTGNSAACVSFSLPQSPTTFLRNKPLLPFPSTLTPSSVSPFSRHSNTPLTSRGSRPAELKTMSVCAFLCVAVWDCNVITVAAAQGFSFLSTTKAQSGIQAAQCFVPRALRLQTVICPTNYFWRHSNLHTKGPAEKLREKLWNMKSPLNAWTFLTQFGIQIKRSIFSVNIKRFEQKPSRIPLLLLCVCCQSSPPFFYLHSLSAFVPAHGRCFCFIYNKKSTHGKKRRPAKGKVVRF